MSGSEFRKWRRAKEITQQAVADYCSVNKATICRWEKGKISISKELYNKLILFIGLKGE